MVKYNKTKERPSKWDALLVVAEKGFEPMTPRV